MCYIFVQYIYEEFGLSTGMCVEYFSPVYLQRIWVEYRCVWNILVQYIYKDVGLSTCVFAEYFSPVYL